MWSPGQHLRSTADNHAAHSVGEAVGGQTGDVVVHDLHLAALELSHLVQADLVFLRVLRRDREESAAGQGLCSPLRNYLKTKYVSACLLSAWSLVCVWR